MGYIPESTDFSLSSFTGLTRESWRAAGKYLLKGLFDALPDTDAPPLVKRTEKEITYPHLDASESEQDIQRRAEIFEGLTRTFFIASVLLNDEPDLAVGGISLREYYRLHIIRSCADRESDKYAGSYSEMLAAGDGADPFRPFQQTVETCALVIGLSMCEHVIWDSYSKAEQDAIADFLSGFAAANTVPQNWRLFNMLDMAFLYRHGYAIDERIMTDHAQAVLNYYAGDGWYRDGHSFDYYSCWAFNFYAPLWNVWYGYERMPEIAAKFEQNSNRLMETYPRMFDRDGFVNMWGRSCIYRNAATSPFDGNIFLEHSALTEGLDSAERSAQAKKRLGWVRRICSGALLQFLLRDDFLAGGVPSLGFYGQFTPLVQGYSCAESPFWLGKAFMCLHLPAGHPFWTVRESEGEWEDMADNEVGETVLPGPALAITNHTANGETVLRTAKVLKAPDDEHGMWNYSKLCFNTKYPWEAAPCDDVESQQYVLKSALDGHVEKANVTFFAGERDGILYRRQFFGYNLETECHWLNAVDLADFPVPYGIFRADRLRVVKRPMEITLGAYGFPDPERDTLIERRERDGARAVILSGRNAQGKPRCLAMTVWERWKELNIVLSTGTDPDSEHSVVVYAAGGLYRQYDASEGYIFLSQVLTREDGGSFTDDELFPVERVEYADKGRTGAWGPVRIVLRSGAERVVDFAGIEGRLEL